ncbi:helix-turn-helix transcriptional regulator [Amantichitinum ursilacus]|uniref:TCP pilus virulence regulatory protein n=1 Tax=Amantichitinum ursilacus TaxID=857265 RepID=A0A0N0XI98_9NEIS|nr:AraC family transcriptional regulator [Amantichitinum ursilacus]KPC49530.1 TCP pilus virulence regulatory protein [Amantichitinum ursilacus]
MPARFGNHARTVSNRIALYAMHAAEQQGVGPQLFAARTGISAPDLQDPKGRIDAERHRRMTDLMAELRPRLDLHTAQSMGLFPDFPVLGSLCLNARTAREAIVAFLDYRALIGEFDFLLFRPQAGQSSFEYIAEFAPNTGFQALSNFLVLAQLIRSYDQGARTLFRVELVGPSIGMADLAECFGAPVRFDAAVNRMTLSSAQLDIPFAQYNASLAPFLLGQAQQELARIQRLHLFSAQVENVIAELLHADSGDVRKASLLAQICERLGTSRWTLHRQLQQEGVHFSELETRVKVSEARRLLSQTRWSLGQISEQLGFSSQSAFTRFFKSQHELAPLAFRQRAHG